MRYNQKTTSIGFTMKVKTFPLSQEQKANEFIDSVVLVEEGAVQVTSDNTIVVFYKAPKETYQEHFVNEMLESLHRNLFHEQIRKYAVDAELQEYKDKGGKTEGFDDVIKRQKEANDNIRMFEAKIAALESWKSS